MTARELFCPGSRGRLADRSFHSPVSLCGDPRAGEGCGTHQVVGADTQADPAMHAVLAMVTTAVQSMWAFEHTDSAFRSDSPPLSPTEPALAFVRAPREGLRATARQDDSADAPNCRRLFIGRGAEPAIAGGEVRRAAEDRLMPIQRRRPQGDVGRSPRMHFVGGDDLMFRFLNRDQFAELVGFGDLAFANRFRVWFEHAEDFIGDVGIAAQYARPRLVDD